MTLPVIADASPLIGLARSGLLGLLADLYGEVVVPPAVLAELKMDEDRPGAIALREAVEAAWLQLRKIHRTGELSVLESRLDRGEAESIVLARQVPHRFLLIDERHGRKIARRQGIRIVGTGGVLIAAKKRGLIDAVSPALDRLVAAGYRLAPGLRAEISRLAGE